MEQLKKRKVLLVGWDAADWEHINPLLDEGLMPSLDGLINRGVMGNLATLQPILSPMLWNSIATGKFPDKHGIHGFIEPDPVNGGARPYTSTSRKCKAIWNILTQSGMRSNIIGWWASHPAEPINGIVVTNAFGGVKFDPEKGWSVPPGTIHPEEKSAQLAQFRVFQNELTEQHVLPFIPNAAKIDQKKDRHLGPFTKTLSDAASIHAVGTAIMEAEPWDFTAVYYDAVDHFSHAFMQYHPPRLPWIREEDFEMYKDVVKGAYRFHDMMLERLLALAGPETTVILCSDHGFESGRQRPRGIPREPAGPAIWHRQYGIFVVAGPGIKKDERIYGASLVDITPTILTLFGLPVGQDMDGRPLLEIFETPTTPKLIPSWDKVEGEAGMHPEGRQLNKDQANELMQQFAALGYIEDPNVSKEKQAESAEIEAKYNIARTYLWKNRPAQARTILEEIVHVRPWEDRFLLQLVAAYLAEGHLGQAERLISSAYNTEDLGNSSVALLWARIKMAQGDFETALRYLSKAQELDSRLPVLQAYIGDIYVRLLKWNEGEAAYKKALELDPDNALALQGLSTIYRRRGDNERTADAAMRAVSLLFRLPVAHFNLGVALARSGETERAEFAFKTALRFQPEMLNAHRFLAFLYRSMNKLEEARFHRGEVARLTQASSKRRREAKKYEDRKFDLPPIPSQAERRETLLRERPVPKPQDQEKSGKTFVLVSGLPRSGTSLMMQMLEAGGLKILTDRERAADVDNPKGYYEWEPIKQIAKKPELLDSDDLNGHVIKCISMLLPSLPPKHDYKVIFMVRPIEQVIASQKKMTTRLGTKGAELEREQLERGMHAHRNEALSWLKRTPNFELLTVDYPDLVRDPQSIIPQLVTFLGEERLTSSEKMAQVIDPALHRRREKTE